MSRKRARKELQTYEVFSRELREDVSVAAEYDLPLTVLALIIRNGWDEGSVRRVLDALRTADLVALPSDEEVLVALPNTSTADARMVEGRLRDALPEVSFGVAAYKLGEAAEDLLGRARSAVQGES